MTKSKLLVTGLGGFAGSHILEHFLINTDWEIIGIDSWRHKGCPERIEEVLRAHPEWKDRVTLITHDLIAPITERTQKRIGHIDYIINCAAESHVDRSIEDPVPFILNNVNAAVNMLEFARVCKPKMFIQISTDEVYGPAPEGVKHKEWSSIIPSNPYSASKAMQEDAAIAYWRTYNVPVVITNTMNMLGQMQDPEKYMAKTIRLVNEDGVVPVHGDSSGFGSRFYLHSRNHADALLWILRNVVPQMYPDFDRPTRFNVVGDTELNNYEVAELIASIIGKPLKWELIDHHSTRPGHDKRYALDGQKISDAGWQAPVDLKESMEKYVRWTLEHPIWL